MIRVQAGVTRKRGLPRFSSAQASCAIDTEVEGAWPQDPDRLSETIRGLYRLCEAAVEEELDRIEQDSHRPEAQLERPASPAQLRLIQSLARRKRIDLVEFLAERVRDVQTSALTSDEASHAIDLLSSAAPGRLQEPPRRLWPAAPPIEAIAHPPAVRGRGDIASGGPPQGHPHDPAVSAAP